MFNPMEMGGELYSLKNPSGLLKYLIGGKGLRVGG